MSIYDINIGDGLFPSGTKVTVKDGSHKGRTGTIIETEANDPLSSTHYWVCVKLGKNTKNVPVPHRYVERAQQ
jgi:ribosomal protein S4E